MAYMVSANMDQGSTDFQIEAAISKIFGSVRFQACREGRPVWELAFETNLTWFFVPRRQPGR